MNHNWKFIAILEQTNWIMNRLVFLCSPDSSDLRNNSFSKVRICHTSSIPPEYYRQFNFQNCGNIMFDDNKFEFYPQRNLGSPDESDF